MDRFLRTVIFALAYGTLSGAIAEAQPYIYGHGVRNGASYMPASLPGGAVAQGSIFTIFGTGLGPVQGVQASAFPIQTSLAGVSVTVMQGSTKLASLPLYVSAGQINAIMPSTVVPGRVAVTVTYDSVVSNPSQLTIVASAFGIFAANSGGFGPGILTNFVTAANQPINALLISATHGQTITIWGTGLGAVPTDNVAPSPGNLAAPIEVFVGGVSATVAYHGRSPCCAGLDQVIFTVPVNVPTGCYVPVVVRAGGTVVSNAVTMAIAPIPGSACSDASNVVEQALVSGQSTGIVAPLRSDVDLSVMVSTPVDAAADYLFSALLKPAVSPYFFFPYVSLPPTGACTVYSFDGNFNNTSLPGTLTAGQFLNGGTPVVAGASPIASQSMFYAALLGGNNSTFFANPPVFSPPNSTNISTPGGADAGAFNVNIPTAGTLQWTNRDSIGPNVDHAKPLTVTWTTSGLSNTQLLIGGGNFDPPNNASTIFLCSANVSAGTFTVPTWAMANVPATSPGAVLPYGNVFIAAPFSGPVPFTATGLGAGFALFTEQFATSVVWQ